MLRLIQENMKTEPVESVTSTKGRCGSCKGCTSPNCGKCDNCKDKILFGGENKRKKACKGRKCIMLARLTVPSMESNHKNKKRNLEEKPATPIPKKMTLPKIVLETMTLSELKSFIPDMIKLATGRDEVWHNRRSAKPTWWPDELTWATSSKKWLVEKCCRTSLQSVVRCCYKHYNQENQLSESVKGLDLDTFKPPSSQKQAVGQAAKTEQIPPSPVKTAALSLGVVSPFCAEIYICYFCEKEFLNKQKMHSHQKTCSERPPKLQQYHSNARATQECIHKDPPPMSPHQGMVPKYSTLPLKQFCGHLELVPKETAVKLRANRASLEIDCNLEEIEPSSPVTPVTPRTPHSLISQLSRDDSGGLARKRLSYSISLDKDYEIGYLSPESSDSEDDQGDLSKAEKKETNLLTIPVSSLLGQRIKNNVHVESPMSVVENMELFCRTPVKNVFLDKLRKKASSYPILYRPRKLAYLHKQNHLYKFTKRQTREFLCKSKTGLTLSSFDKSKRMKRAKVVMAKLTREELLRWLPAVVIDRVLHRKFNCSKAILPETGVSNSCVFPSGPTLLSPNIDKLLGLKKRSTQEPRCSVNTSLSIGNFVSEDIEEEVSKQKLTLYKSLLYEMSVVKPVVVIKDISVGITQKEEKQPKHVSQVNDMDTYGPFNVKPQQKHVAGINTSTNKKVKAVSPCTRSRYSTLLSILNPKEVSDDEKLKVNGNVKDSSVPSVYGRVLESSDSSVSSVYGRVLESSEGSSMSHSEFRSPTVCVGNAKHQSPVDDDVSIMSLSSDGENFNPSCCISCRSKSLISPCQGCTESPTGIGMMSPSPSYAKVSNDWDVLKPLNVLVDDNPYKPLPAQSSSQMYGIPSPMTIRSDSPLPLTFTNHSSTPNQIVTMPDSDTSSVIKTVEQFSNLDSTRCLRSGKSQNIFVQKAVGNDCADSPHVLNRLSSLRSTTRSKSLTPASSPMRLETPLSGSLPNSTSKSVSKAQGSVKAVSMSSVKRMLLCEVHERMGTRCSHNNLKRTFPKTSDTQLESSFTSNSVSVGSDKNSRIRKCHSDISFERRDLRSRGVKRKASTTHSFVDGYYL